MQRAVVRISKTTLRQYNECPKGWVTKESCFTFWKGETSSLALGPNQPSIEWVDEVNRPGHKSDQSPLYRIELKNT